SFPRAAARPARVPTRSPHGRSGSRNREPCALVPRRSAAARLPFAARASSDATNRRHRTTQPHRRPTHGATRYALSLALDSQEISGQRPLCPPPSGRALPPAASTTFHRWSRHRETRPSSASTSGGGYFVRLVPAELRRCEREQAPTA